MPGNPTRGQLHANQPLTNLSVAYLQKASNFMARQVFPVVAVNKQSDTYYIYDIGDFFRTDAKKRAPGTESAGAGWRTSTANYFCDVWGVHKDVADQDRNNADSVFDLDRDSTEFITLDMLISEEVDWASSYFTTSLWTGSTTGTDITPGALWDTAASTPIEDVRAEVRSIQRKTGMNPNTLVLGTDVYDALVDHPDIIDRIKYTQKAVITNDMLAAMFNVQRVFVADAVRNTAAEEATDVMANIVTRTAALLCYAEPNPGLMKPSAGYTFAWKGQGGNNAGVAIKKFRMEHLESDRIEIASAYDHKLVAANLGVFFTGAVS